MTSRTKIICTIGPSVSKYEDMLALIDVGMNVARINFSHGTHAQHKETIENLKKARAERGVPLAILLDTKGPEVRVGELENGSLALTKGEEVMLGEGGIPLNPPHIIDDLDVGTVVLFDDGYIETKVIQKKKHCALLEVMNSGILKSSKGVNVPKVHLSLPAMTEQDTIDITFGCEMDVDFIAGSFIRSAQHVLEIKQLLADQGKSDISVISKIENAEGVENFDSILQVSDGIMVARGDLGVELPLEKVPSLQKMMIRKCYKAFKPVVTATQMLESMIHNPRPTRAEVSDVANAIYDNTSAVMLSGETAVGKYPLEAVRIMKRTIREAECDCDYSAMFYREAEEHNYNDVGTSVALAAVKTSFSANAKMIVSFTSSGFTPRAMARFRPQIPILAITPFEKTYHQLAFNWGITPVHKKVTSFDEGFKVASCFALSQNIIEYGDLVIASVGSHFGMTGTTDTLCLRSCGEVLVRGVPFRGEIVDGVAMFVLSMRRCNTKGKIVIINRCDESYKPLFKGAKAFILQNHPDDITSEKIAAHFSKDVDIPLLLRGDGARAFIEEGQLITLDPARGLVFNGRLSDQEEFIQAVCASPLISSKKKGGE